jgi:hypothetical protein
MKTLTILISKIKSNNTLILMPLDENLNVTDATRIEGQNLQSMLS